MTVEITPTHGRLRQRLQRVRDQQQAERDQRAAIAEQERRQRVQAAEAERLARQREAERRQEAELQERQQRYQEELARIKRLRERQAEQDVRSMVEIQREEARQRKQAAADKHALMQALAQANREAAIRDRERFGQEIVRLREVTETTREQLATVALIDLPTLTDIEEGRIRPSQGLASTLVIWLARGQSRTAQQTIRRALQIGRYQS